MNVLGCSLTVDESAFPLCNVVPITTFETLHWKPLDWLISFILIYQQFVTHWRSLKRVVQQAGWVENVDCVKLSVEV